MYTVEQAFEIAKASVGECGAFSDAQLTAWFDAALQVCAAYDGTDTSPAHQVSEPGWVEADGSIRLTSVPNGQVQIYSNGVLVANVYARGKLIYAPAILCCCPPDCLELKYWVGDFCAARGGAFLTPAFVEAVSRVFAYIVENRGDDAAATESYGVISASGAKAFLTPVYIW